jgi:phosphohistidine phosphatase
VQLLLLRHAAAEEARPGLTDAERALTPRGRERMALAVPGLLAWGLRPARLLASPLLRARQTAEIVADACAAPVEVLPALAALPSEQLLAELRGADALAVGHEPWISQLCAWLVVGRIGAAAGFPFKKGGAALLDGEPAPGGMRLVALLPPRVLRALGPAG